MNTVKFIKALNKAYPHIIPEFARPRWYELRRRLQLKQMRKVGLKFELVDRK